MQFLRLLVPSALLLFVAGAAHAQSTQAAEAALWDSDFEDDPVGLDPNAPQVSAPSTPPQAAPDIDMSYGPRPRSGRAVAGDALTAVQSVYESRHDIHVQLGEGLAQVEVKLRFENHADEPAEVRYRLSAPAAPVPTFLEVCHDKQCRPGLATARSDGPTAYDAALLARGAKGADAPYPIGELYAIQDERGSSLVLHAAPVSESRPVDVTLRYIVPLPLIGGVSRLHIPARGMDPRAARAQLSVSGDLFGAMEVDGHAVSADSPYPVEAWAGVSLRAKLRPTVPPQLSVNTLPCGQKTCQVARARARFTGAKVAPGELLIAVDVSPSTTGPARNRMTAALAALLETTPSKTPVRAAMFASKAQWLQSSPVIASVLPLTTFQGALKGPDLGSATRLSAVLELAGRARRRSPRPLLVVLGDGGLTTGAEDVLQRVAKKGYALALVNLGDRPVRHEIREAVHGHGGLVVEAGEAGSTFERTRDPAVLEERMNVLFAPTASPSVRWSDGSRTVHLGPLREGESLEFRTEGKRGRLHCPGSGLGVVSARPLGRSAGKRPIMASLLTVAKVGDAPLLSAVSGADVKRGAAGFPAAPRFRPAKKSEAAHCDRRGPARRESGINRDENPILLAHDRACAPARRTASASEGLGRGMPATPLLGMLRKRIIPVARECFRRDRAGRADYAVRAVFRFELADQEVADARVEGPIPAALRNCLLTAVDTLHVPRFTGRVRVSYPLHTLRETLPATIELSAEATDDLDSILRE